MKGIEKLRAQIAADPEAVTWWEKQGRKLRPLELKSMAWIEALFPPPSPTSKARGGKKLAPPPQFMDAVCQILDAKMGFEIEQSDFVHAMKSGDPDYFRMMADAAAYIQEMPREVSMFADCLITARRIASGMIKADGTLPTRGTVIDAVIKYLGPAAFPKDEKTRWSEVMKAAGLSDLRRTGSARTSIPKNSGLRKKKPSH